MSREQPVERPDADGDGTTADGTHTERSVRGRVTAGRDRIRSTRRGHAVALVVATAAGLGLAWVHWLGLVAGGALVGLVAPTLRRAPLYGVGFGLVALVAFAAVVGGTLPAVFAMTPIVYLTAAAGLGLPVLGSLVRGLE